MNGITIVQPRFNSFVLPNAPLEELASGFRWLEGPVWFADHQCLQHPTDVTDSDNHLNWFLRSMSVCLSPNERTVMKRAT